MQIDKDRFEEAARLFEEARQTGDWDPVVKFLNRGIKERAKKAAREDRGDDGQPPELAA